MASDITANDLVGIVDKTELISKSRLPTRFPTEVWKGTCTFRGRSAVVRNIDVSQLLVTHVRLPQIAIKIMRQLMLPDYESSLVVNSLTSQFKYVFHNLSSVSGRKHDLFTRANILTWSDSLELLTSSTGSEVCTHPV